MQQLIKKLTSLGERQGNLTIAAAGIIESFLREKKVVFAVENVVAELPEGTSKLMVDGKILPSLPTSFIGGTINGKTAIVSSLIPSKYLIGVPNINFNPKCREISRSNFYFAPSVAVEPARISEILAGNMIQCSVRVKKRRFNLPQFLVGNLKSPRVVVFSRYDSIGPGAIDNSSGTAVCLSLVASCPNLLEDALFIFDPNEELSYDRPTYWGHGYRVFERRNARILRDAKRVIVVDCVGNGVPTVIRDPKILELAFPIKNKERLEGDLVTVGADIGRLMDVYHSNLDLDGEISLDCLRKAEELVKKLITENMLL